MSASAERVRTALALACWALLLVSRGAGADAARRAEPEDVRRALGGWVDAIVEASRTDTARLRVVAADEADAALGVPDRIAGYPLRERLRRVDPERARRIRELLLDPARYSDVVLRCRHAALIGVRFTSAQGTIDLALGTNCPTALWAFPSPAGPVERWGGVLTDSTAREVLRLLSAPDPGAP